jgi:hypothetical protein
MSDEEMGRLIKVFEKFSTDHAVAGVYQASFGNIETYRSESRLMDRTAFVLAVMDFNRGAPTVSDTP